MAVNVGDVIFRAEVPGSSLEAIALFSVATEDPNPIHVDPEFARDCGFDQVIQQGPMTTAHFAQLLAKRFGVERLVSLDLAFTAPVFPNESLTMTATVVDVDDRIRLQLASVNASGVQTAKGTASIALGDD